MTSVNEVVTLCCSHEAEMNASAQLTPPAPSCLSVQGPCLWVMDGLEQAVVGAQVLRVVVL